MALHPHKGSTRSASRPRPTSASSTPRNHCPAPRRYFVAAIGGSPMKIELLERRRLLSASVAQTSPGYFEIQGDDSANVINVQVSQGDDTFSLDGVTYSNVNFISVFGNGGDDIINVQSSD